MEPKSVVVKSKSSNINAIANKNEKRNKFSRSAVQFHPLNMKKRGVYVENKENNIQQNVFDNKEEEIKRKPPPRPRPGQKRFLTSVLNILSKSTTGTQYPDNSESAAVIKKFGNKQTPKLREKRTTINEDKDIKPGSELEVIDQEVNVNLKGKNKKQKYKSKILNTKDYLTSANDKFVILQSKKDIEHTPSNYSEMSKNFTINESRNPIRELLENNIYSGVAEGLAKEVLEGSVVDKPVKVTEDPSTLVADVPKDDKKIYNFFVDLLETTFDVYNVNTDAMAKMDSDTILEIDETVATKLNTKNETITTCRSRDHHELNFDIKADKPFVPLSESVELKPVKVKKVTKQKKLKAKSFIYAKAVAPKPSRELKRKPLSKAAKRKDLLNTIKEELRMDIDKYEEPQNLYQALRTMAKYKRKCQAKRTIQFEVDYKNKNFNRECIFSQGIFPMRRLRKLKLSQPEPKPEKKISDYRNRFLRIPKPKAVPVESSHSLEVFGIEYEPKETPFEKRQYEMYLSSESEVEIDPTTIMGMSDSSVNMFSLVHD